jgi:hypothetical protein
LLDCSRSWFWRAFSPGTSKTPPELIGAILEVGELLSHVADHGITSRASIRSRELCIVPQILARFNGRRGLRLSFSRAWLPRESLS